MEASNPPLKLRREKLGFGLSNRQESNPNKWEQMLDFQLFFKDVTVREALPLADSIHTAEISAYKGNRILKITASYIK